MARKARKEETGPYLTTISPVQRVQSASASQREEKKDSLQEAAISRSASLQHQHRPALSRLSSNSSVASKGSKGRHRVVAYPGTTARDVLFGHYLSMSIEQEKKAQHGYEKPGALAWIFLTLVCFPTDLFDVHTLTKLGQKMVVRMARAVILLGFLLVPLWLVLVWAVAAGTKWQDMVAAVPSCCQLVAAMKNWWGLAEAGRSLLQAAAGFDWQKLEAAGGYKLAGSLPELSTPKQWLMLAMQAGPLVIGGLVFFIICDAIDAAATRRDADKQRGMIKPTHLAPMSPPASAYHAKSSHASPPVHHATANSTAHTARAPAAASASETKASKRGDNPRVREVRSAVIKLEHEVLGNEVTGALLPLEVLPARVSKLCEEVGLPCSDRPDLEEMAQLVKSVAEQVGVELE